MGSFPLATARLYFTDFMRFKAYWPISFEIGSKVFDKVTKKARRKL